MNMKYAKNTEVVNYIAKSEAARSKVREEIWCMFNEKPADGFRAQEWAELGGCLRNFWNDIIYSRQELLCYYYCAVTSVDFIQRVIANLPFFEGKVYNVKLDKMIKVCLEESLRQAQQHEVLAKLKGYVEFSEYNMQYLRFFGIASSSLNESISFSLDFKELVDSESRRIVKGEAMQSIILELKKDVEYLESKIEETLKSLHNLQKESILRKIVQSAIKIKREMIKQDSLLQDIFSPHAYHYKRDSYYTAIPKYNR